MVINSRERSVEVTDTGIGFPSDRFEDPSHTPEAKARRAETMRRQEAARRAWRMSDLPEWLNDTVYRERIMPAFRSITSRAIMEVLQVSKPYAADIRSGKCVPHPGHWQTLAQLTGMSKVGKMGL